MKTLLVFLAGAFVALLAAYLYLVWIFNRNRS